MADMTFNKSILAAALAAILASSAAAQDAETAPEADAAAPAGSADAETAPDGPQEGETYIAEEFGDWDFACIRSGTGNDPCRFTQTLENAEGGRVAQVSVVPLPPGEAVAAAAIIETPLGTLLRVPRTADDLAEPGGLRMQVDDGELRVFQFTFCNPGGCVAEIGMEEELIAEFKRGAVATLTIWSAEAPDQPVELGLSLSGFTAGYDRVAALASGGDQ